MGRLVPVRTLSGADRVWYWSSDFPEPLVRGCSDLHYWADATAIAVSFSIVGAIIASRRPEHPVGWLFCTIGVLAAVDHLCGEYATYALLGRSDLLLAGEAAAWVRSWIWSVTGGLGVFLLLVFPDAVCPTGAGSTLRG